VCDVRNVGDKVNVGAKLRRCTTTYERLQERDHIIERQLGIAKDLPEQPSSDDVP